MQHQAFFTKQSSSREFGEFLGKPRLEMDKSAMTLFSTKTDSDFVARFCLDSTAAKV